MHKIPFTCPACQEGMHVTELTCPSCATKVQGVFAASGLNRLSQEQLSFVEVFMRCRGNIKEVEKELKISYPTVRSRLDQIVQDMGYPTRPDADIDERDAVRSEILDALGTGDLSFDEALEKLKGANQA